MPTKKLANIHRRLSRINRKQNRRKKSKRNAHQYEQLELRRVLNAAPVGIVDASYFTQVGIALDIDEPEDGLLANDYDLDVELSGDTPFGGGGIGGAGGSGGGGGGYNGPLYAENYSTELTAGMTANGGTLIGNEDGTFTYTPPNSSFEGFDWFTYQVFDGQDYSEETLVTISVGHSLSGQLNGAERVGGNFLHTGALQTTQTLGGGLELNYRSDATPTTIVAVETMLLEGAATPDSISVETIFAGIPSGITNYIVDGSFDDSEAMRLVQAIDVPNLATGMYDWTMTVTLHFNGGDDQVHEFTGQQAVTNRTDSYFGNGWWLNGLDQLHVTQGEGALLENGDGTTYYFAQDDSGSAYQHAIGDQTFSTLTESSGIYTLTDKWGNYRVFDSTGRITGLHRINSSTADFTYAYVGNKLDTITDISGRIYSFNYDAAGHLDNVVDFATRTTDLTITAGGLLTEVVVADEMADPIDYPNYVAPAWSYGYLQVDSEHIYLNSITDPGGATTDYEYDSQTNRLSKVVHADLSEWQLFPALTQGFVGTGTHNLFQTGDADARYIDERGEIFGFETDGFGNVTTFTDAELAVTQFAFDQNGQLIGVVEPDPDGTAGTEIESSVTRTGYSELGDLVLIVNPDDTTREIEYHNELHQVTRITDELGNYERFYYYDNISTDGDQYGNLERYEDASFNDTLYEYDEFGNVTLVESDYLGSELGRFETKYIYDSIIHNRLIEVQINAGANQAFETSQMFGYNLADQLITVTDYISSTHTRITSHVYDPLDRLVKTTLADPDDFTAIGGSNGAQLSPVYTYSYHANLQIESVTDPLGNVTTYGYDPDRHFLTSVTQPDPDGAGLLNAPVTTYEYYANGLLHKEFRPEFTGNNHIEYIYDGNGNATSVLGPLAGQVTTYAYDDAQRLESMTDVSGRTIAYQYDIRHRLIHVIDHDIDTTDALPGPTTSYEYDDVGRPNRQVDPLGRFTAYTYYANGLLEQTLIQNANPEAEDGLISGGGSSFGGGGGSGPTFDGLQATTYDYDKLNRLISTTDPSGRETEYVYNTRGHLVQTIAPDPDPDDGDNDDDVRSTFYAYDWLGRTTSITDALGRVTSYGYDNLDRVVRVTLPDPDDYTNSPGGGTDGPLGSPVYHFEYDAVGNRLKTIDPLTRETIIQYDNLYRPTFTTEAFTSSLKKKGRGSGGGFQHEDYIAHWRIKYNDQLQVAEVIDPEGASTFGQYDSIGRLTGVVDDYGNTTIYGYDLLNRLETITEPDPDGQSGPLESLVTNYTYDILSRITVADGVNGQTTQQYNDAGELIALTDELGNTTQFAYDLQGRLALETDALGNTTSNTYNIHGRLVRQADRNGNVVWYGQQRFTSTERWFQRLPVKWLLPSM